MGLPEYRRERNSTRLDARAIATTVCLTVSMGRSVAVKLLRFTVNTPFMQGYNYRIW